MSLQADRELPGISGLQNTGFEEPPDRIHFPANVEPSLGKPHVIEDGTSITLPGIAEKRDDRSLLTPVRHRPNNVSGGPHACAGRSAA